MCECLCEEKIVVGCSFWHLCEDMIEAYSWTDAFLTFCNTPRPEHSTGTKPRVRVQKVCIS